MTTKEKLAALSIADLEAMATFSTKRLAFAESSPDEVTCKYWVNVRVCVLEELNSRITDIFGPIQ